MRIGKRQRQTDITFQWFHLAIYSPCNGTKLLWNGYVAFEITVCQYFVYFRFPFFRSSILQIKLPSFHDVGLYRERSAPCQGLLQQWKCNIRYTIIIQLIEFYCKIGTFPAFHAPFPLLKSSIRNSSQPIKLHTIYEVKKLLNDYVNSYYIMQTLVETLL